MPGRWASRLCHRKSSCKELAYIFIAATEITQGFWGSTVALATFIHSCRLVCRSASGHGANMTIEDGAVLAYYLQRHGLSEAAVRAYEADRAPCWRKIAAHVHDVVAGRARAKDAQDGSNRPKAGQGRQPRVCA